MRTGDRNSHRQEKLKSQFLHEITPGSVHSSRHNAGKTYRALHPQRTGISCSDAQPTNLHPPIDGLGGAAMVLMIVLLTTGLFVSHWFCLVGGNELGFDLKAF